MPWRARLAAGCALTYFISPIQVIPTFIPIIGQLDDLLALYLAMKVIRKHTPIDVLNECRPRPKIRGRAKTYLTDVSSELVEGHALVVPGDPGMDNFTLAAGSEFDQSSFTAPNLPPELYAEAGKGSSWIHP